MFHGQRTLSVPAHNSAHNLDLQRGTRSSVSDWKLSGLRCSLRWAWEELNFRPHAYQSRGRSKVCAQVVENRPLPPARIAGVRARSAPELCDGAYPGVPCAQLLSGPVPRPGRPMGGR
jgi:hypothetical protein